jgi:uncharacterized protein (DUF1786 family)
MQVQNRVREATRQGRPVILSGHLMGGGPSQWAAEDHLRAGYPVYATEKAALSFNDDLNAVTAMGITVIGEDEVRNVPGDPVLVVMRDFDYDAIHTAMQAFGVRLDGLSAVAVAVFDHGAAPVDVSDRQFRFDYLDSRIRAENKLSAFAYLRNDIPPIMTRLQAIADSADGIDAPLIVMDTAPAAVAGALLDPRVSSAAEVVITNVGNFHTLAFRLGSQGIEGVFEHHTGLIDRPRLETLIQSLAGGTLKHADVFNEHGHGALVYSRQPMSLDPQAGNLVVTGPRRAMLRSSKLQPYFAVPFGDMMIAGCFGLIRAVADILPDLRAAILPALLNPGGVSRPPWEVD